MSTVASSQRDHLSRLPAELKCAVVRYLTALKDLKTLSLLSKYWATVVMPIVWETLTTDLLTKTGSRNVLGLADPASNIVKHVRRIHLLDRPKILNEADQLPQLLAAIPRDQLCGFKSGSGVSVAVLQLLLQIHTKLEQLDVSATDLSHIFHSPWTGTSLSGLVRMDISVNTLALRTIQELWTRLPKLKHIRLIRTAMSQFTSTSTILQEDHFESNTETAVSQAEVLNAKDLDTIRLQLISLHIGDLVLPATFSTMFQRIDIIALNELVLDGTLRVAELLKTMCSEFQNQKPLLRKLRLIRISELTSREITLQLQLFLLSFHGLHQLHFQCSNCIKIDIDSIINDGETLTDLLVVNGGIHRQERTRCMSADDLQKIAIACPGLEQLCLNLHEIDPDTPEGDFLGPHPTIRSTSTEFENALGAIASMRSLRSLRLTNPLNYRKAYHSQGEFMRFFRRSLENGEQRYAFQSRADSIIRYLGDRGSNIRLLAFSPIELLSKATAADKNGHIWPNYFYACERMQGRRGTEISIARAVSDWRTEVPEVTILEIL